MYTLEERKALREYDDLASIRENITKAIDRIPFKERIGNTPEFLDLFIESRKAKSTQDRFVNKNAAYIKARMKSRDDIVQAYARHTSIKKP